MKLSKIIVSTLIGASIFSHVLAASETNTKNEWITLGTMAGPIPNATHSQPANALLVNGKTYLVDAGDGTAGQLAKVGLNIKKVDAIFLSHLHFDHTGGLPAILSLRWQTETKSELTIYGPPGTKQTVDGIFAYMTYGALGHYGVPGQVPPPPSSHVKVVEVTDGSRIDFDGFNLSVIRNSHYSWPKGSEEYDKFQALSFKFELTDYSVVYTGDTGPSEAVELLSQNVDLLISEMMDVEHTVNLVKRMNPMMPAKALGHMQQHLSKHHLVPADVGQLATKAKVKKLVVTHMAPGLVTPAEFEKYTNEVAEFYKGDITIANDLDRFTLQK
ncbi:MBL fold metallo-hydrolase [Alteromonas sp. CI.11.F.A3]|uniref:MBL fold metallo-hydrolase n=1 Tax=unclassified Alteromonas TaxID=2614992 RepID=UPI001B39D377|nr:MULTISPECIES: MBL fold metallo-hydrolase [unclassified Alteromonas]MBQ4828428.1 MBL fold metallo-hydrolase [Alteromonas sp. MMG017]WOI36353.1 MBL fold metallo-hydrolase [Alteromonas sp. CI.11.F.A3]